MLDYSTLGLLSIGIIMIVLIVVTVPVRRKSSIRPIEAYEAMPGMIGRTIESDRPLHLSFGDAGIGGESTLIALAAAELAYQLTRRAAIGDRSPLLTLSNPSAIPLAQDSLRRAYQQRGYAERYRALAVRWYPSGGRSLAFSAALSAMLAAEKIGGNALVGSYGSEIALVLNTASRMRIPSVAVSDQLEGQAVAYLMADMPLIGEEIFVAGAYLDDSASAAKVLVSMDVLRYLLIAAMLGGLLLSLGD